MHVELEDEAHEVDISGDPYEHDLACVWLELECE